jgi:Zn-finger nucleic acid-binding protein
VFLNCPRCGLSIKPKARWLALEYCPRCMARARTPVKLFSSTLPAAELYPDDAAPNPEPRERTHTRTR